MLSCYWILRKYRLISLVVVCVIIASSAVWFGVHIFFRHMIIVKTEFSAGDVRLLEHYLSAPLPESARIKVGTLEGYRHYSAIIRIECATHDASHFIGVLRSSGITKDFEYEGKVASSAPVWNDFQCRAKDAIEVGLYTTVVVCSPENGRATILIEAYDGVGSDMSDIWRMFQNAN